MLEIQFYKSSYILLIINCTEKFNICAIYYLTDITTISSEHDKRMILCKLTSTFLFLSPPTSPSPATASSPPCTRGAALHADRDSIKVGLRFVGLTVAWQSSTLQFFLKGGPGWWNKSRSGTVLWHSSWLAGRCVDAVSHSESGWGWAS